MKIGKMNLIPENTPHSIAQELYFLFHKIVN